MEGALEEKSQTVAGAGKTVAKDNSNEAKSAVTKPGPTGPTTTGSIPPLSLSTQYGVAGKAKRAGRSKRSTRLRQALTFLSTIPMQLESRNANTLSSESDNNELPFVDNAK